MTFVSPAPLGARPRRIAPASCATHPRNRDDDVVHDPRVRVLGVRGSVPPRRSRVILQVRVSDVLVGTRSRARGPRARRRVRPRARGRRRAPRPSRRGARPVPLARGLRLRLRPAPRRSLRPRVPLGYGRARLPAGTAPPAPPAAAAAAAPTASPTSSSPAPSSSAWAPA